MIEREYLLNLWRLRSIRATIQHYNATHLFKFLDSTLTTVNVIAAISVLYLSSAWWFTGGKNYNPIGLSLAALIAVITSILQYILDYRTRWKSHERAGKGYATLNREIEQIISCQKIDDQNLTTVRERFDHLTDMSPVMPAVLWNRPKALTRVISDLEKRNGQRFSGTD